MEPSTETYEPARLYSRVGWAALAGSLVCVGCATQAPLALAPAVLCALTGALTFWLALRPSIRVSCSQINIGTRTIIWREVCEIRTLFASPLLLAIQLTNDRRKYVVFPGTRIRIGQLMLALHECADSLNAEAETASHVPEVQLHRMLSQEDEEEVERLFQRLKSVGRLDSKPEGSSQDEE